MADETTTDEISTLSLQNIPNLFTRMFNGEIDEKANARGEVIYSMILGYVLGNSVGTANTLKGGQRFHLGPVYVW